MNIKAQEYYTKFINEVSESLTENMKEQNGR